MIGKNDGTLGFLVHDVARMLRALIDRRVESYNLTHAKWQALGILDMSEGISQTELAQTLELERSTVGRLMDRLEARGFIERRPDPTDRRALRLYLTDTARPVLDDLEHVAEEVRSIALTGLSPQEVIELKRMLAIVKGNLQKEAEA